MGKWIGFFVFIYIGAALLSGMMIGGDGLAAARLSSALAPDDDTMYVESTAGFYDGGGEIVIDTEHLTYTGMTSTTFTGVTHGTSGTDAVSHSNQAMVYTLYTDQINQAMGYQVVSSTTSGGASFNVITMGFGFLFHNLPRMLTFSYPFLGGDLAMFQYFMFAGSIALIAALALAFISVATSIIRAFTGGVV